MSGIAKITITPSTTRVDKALADQLATAYRADHSDSYIYITRAAMEKGYEVYLPFDNSTRVLLVVDSNTKTGHLINGPSFLGASTALAMHLSENKMNAYQVAKWCDVPCLDTRLLRSEEDAAGFWASKDGRCILKPLDGSMGRGVVIEFIDQEDYVAQYKKLAATSRVIGQQKAPGTVDVRTLFIGGKFIAATAREGFTICGDGTRTVCDLVDAQNKSNEAMNKSGISVESLICIGADNASAQLNLPIDSIVPRGQTYTLIPEKGVTEGRSFRDITATIHPWYINAASKIARFSGFDVVSVDFVAQDFSDKLPVEELGAYFIETNVRPNFVLHHSPHYGDRQNVAGAYLDHIFNSGRARAIVVEYVS